MALRTIRLEGDPVLGKVCREVTEVTPKIVTLIDDMLETMYEANGVGLAAPQVGILKRIVVIDVGEGPIVMINPEIIESDGVRMTGREKEYSWKLKLYLMRLPKRKRFRIIPL